MAIPPGPELDPGSQDHQWVASVIRAVEHRAGRPTEWNGRIFEETDPRWSGAAHADGSMSLSDSAVLAVVRKAYSGVALTERDHTRIRDAIGTVTHEAVHLVNRNGDSNASDGHPTHDDPGEVLEEGLTERWTQRNLDDIINDVALDRIAPGVVDQQVEDPYPAYTSATNRLLEGVANLSGRTREDVEDRIMATDRAQRWNAMADMVIDHNLADRIPESHRFGIRYRMANFLRSDMAAARQVQETSFNSRTRARQGAQIGERAAANLEANVDRLRVEYLAHQPLPPDRVQHSLEQTPSPDPRPSAPDRGEGVAVPGRGEGVAAPGRGERSDRLSREDGERRGGATPLPVKGDVDPDLARLQNMLTGQAPAADAPNVAPGQATQARRRAGHQLDGRNPSRPQPNGPARE